MRHRYLPDQGVRRRAIDLVASALPCASPVAGSAIATTSTACAALAPTGTGMTPAVVAELRYGGVRPIIVTSCGSNFVLMPTRHLQSFGPRRQKRESWT